MNNFFIEECQIDQKKFKQEFMNRVGEFENCIFEGILFQEVNLSHYKFIDCIFKNCNFSNCDFKSSVQRNSKFEECKLVGINWSLLNNFGQLVFQSCILNYSTFQKMNLSKTKFLNCQLEEVSFEETNLSESDLSESNLCGSNFNKANLKKSDLRRCTQLTIDFSQTNVQGAKINADQAIELIQQIGIIVE